MIFRQVKKEDFEKFLEIKLKFLDEYGISKKTKKFILTEFNKYLKRILILAEENGDLIGYIAGEVEKNNYEKYGYISEIFIKKEYRNKGIASKLKDEFLNELKKQKISLCRIDVNPNNLALEVYKKWGFKIDKHRLMLKI